MLTTLMIGIAGGIGTMLRYGLSLALTGALGAAFPFGTLAVNLLGSFALSLVAELFVSTTFAGADARLLLGVGLMGGFTTYSSFNLEALRLLQQGAYSKAAGYIVATLLGCLVSGVCGLVLARALTGSHSG